MSERRRALALVAVVAGGVVLAPAAMSGFADAALFADVTADPNTAGADSTHTVTATVGDVDSGATLQTVRVDYTLASSPADASGVTAANVLAAGIDTDRDGTIDVNLTDDLAGVEHGHDGGALTVSFDTSHTLASGDFVVLRYDGVVNPSSVGEFPLTVAINAEATDDADVATLVTVDGETTVVDGSADPATVSPGADVSNQVVEFGVENLSADGDSDTFYVEFPDRLAGNLSPNSASVVSGDASISSSVELVDGPDNDSGERELEDTLTFQTNAEGGTLTDLRLQVDTGVQYPANATPGSTYEVTVWVEDSDDTDGFDENVATIEVAGADGTETTTATDGTDGTATQTEAAGTTTDGGDSGGGVPGFTVGAALVALVAAALLAVRRDR